MKAAAEICESFGITSAGAINKVAQIMETAMGHQAMANSDRTWFDPANWATKNPTEIAISRRVAGPNRAVGSPVLSSDQPIYVDGAGPTHIDVVRAVLSLAKERVVITADGIEIQ